ncbi:hypothetical protein M7963_18530 [Enterobacter roggenkampii]|uniref:hypothetical protein n=1 Tax=Enterobacter roggenkampii TaxID=1812935 RepID=UPI0022386589|nr:hypothetical protein [Enterobacter roggenkampii]MCW5003515.1 hypothetical protein [Enterobacter roggenkampii]
MIKKLVLVFLIFSATPAFAWTYCGHGMIDKYEYVYGEEHWIRFHTTSIKSDNWDQNASKEKPNELYSQREGMVNMISMWSDDLPIWTDKAGLLASAYLSQVPVQILSKDDNCQGPQDEFDITLCIQESDCKKKRF